MKRSHLVILLLSVVIFLSCEKDEEKLPEIHFRTGAGYLSSGATMAKGANFTIGIEAAKTEDEDVLKKFDISVSTNGSALNSIVNKDLTRDEGSNFIYEHGVKQDTISGTRTRYVFTITNRDGLINQVELETTTQ